MDIASLDEHCYGARRRSRRPNLHQSLRSFSESLALLQKRRMIQQSLLEKRMLSPKA